MRAMLRQTANPQFRQLYISGVSGESTDQVGRLSRQEYHNCANKCTIALLGEKVNHPSLTWQHTRPLLYRETAPTGG